MTFLDQYENPRPDIDYLYRRPKKEKIGNLSADRNILHQQNNTIDKEKTSPEKPIPSISQKNDYPNNKSLSWTIKPANDVSDGELGQVFKKVDQNTRLTEIQNISKNTVLTDEDPVVRVDKIRSAIGSLVIINTLYVAWEMKDGSTGFLYSKNPHEIIMTRINNESERIQHPPEIKPPIINNRRIIEYWKNGLIINLRHIHLIKRLIIVPEESKNVEAGTVGSITITLPFQSNTCLYLSNVSSNIEFRKESFNGNLYETFNIGTYNSIINHHDNTVNDNIIHSNNKTVDRSDDLQRFFNK